MTRPRPWPGVLSLLAAAFPVLVAAIVWRALLRGYYWNDDFQILYEIANGGLAFFLLQPMFGHVNTARNALLAAEYAVYGPNPAAFFATALAVHCLNALLVWRLGRRLGGTPLISASVATVWALSPLHDGTLAWCAAHGQAILTTITLLLLARVRTLDDSGRPLRWWEALLWVGGLFVAATSYGVGAGVAAMFPLVAIFLAPARMARASRAILLAMPVLLVVVFAALNTLFPDVQGPMTNQVITPLTETLRYPSAIADLTGLLATVGLAGVALGPFYARTLFDSGAIAVAATAMAVVLAVGFWRSDARARRWLLGLAVLVLAAYGVVGLGRAVWLRNALASGALTDRYHYPAQALIAVAVIAASGPLHELAPSGTTAGAVVWAALALVGLVRNPPHVSLHEGDRAFTDAAVAEIRSAIAAAAPGATVRIPNRRFPPLEFLALFQDEWRFPGLAGVFVIFFPSDEVDGRHVVFEATEAARRAAAARGGRIAGLLVPPSGGG